VIVPVLQAYAAEAGAERAEEPMEEAGMSDEIIQKAGIAHCSHNVTNEADLLHYCIFVFSKQVAECSLLLLLVLNFYTSTVVNPLNPKGNYSATSNNTKLVHWPLMGWLVHLVQRGVAWVGCGPA